VINIGPILASEPSANIQPIITDIRPMKKTCYCTTLWAIKIAMWDSYTTLWFSAFPNFRKNEQICGFHWTFKKCFSFRGALPSDSPHQGLCPWTPLGALPSDPHYRLALCALAMASPLCQILNTPLSIPVFIVVSDKSLVLRTNFLDVRFAVFAGSPLPNFMAKPLYFRSCFGRAVWNIITWRLRPTKYIFFGWGLCIT